jgi:hypothetical protein
MHRLVCSRYNWSNGGGRLVCFRGQKVRKWREADPFLEDMELGYSDEAIRGTRFVLFSGRISEDMDVLEEKRSDGYRNSHFKKTNIDCLVVKVLTVITSPEKWNTDSRDTSSF